MGGAHRLAFTATQAVFDGVGDRAYVRLLHDQRFVAHQAEARRVSLTQIRHAHVVFGRRLAQQFAFVEMTVGVYARFVIRKRLQLCIRQIFQFGDANAVFSRDHPVERTRQLHDARHRFVCGVQHVVVVAVDRQVGVHIAVTGVHVQRRPDPAFEHLLVHFVKLASQGGESRAAEQIV